MNYSLVVMPKNEKDLFYSSPEEYDDEVRGLIGHLRGDFGSGAEFHTTFWDRDVCAELKTQDFKDELDLVVNEWRKPGGVLHSLIDMEAFCDKHPSAKFEVWQSYRVYGFKLETEKHSYYIRCCPVIGEYQFYLYCYSRERLPEYLKTLE